MACMKMRWVYISLVVLGAFCLYYNLEDLNPFKGEPVIFKNELGDFLQLPDIDCRQDPPFLVLLVAGIRAIGGMFPGSKKCDKYRP